MVDLMVQLTDNMSVQVLADCWAVLQAESTVYLSVAEKAAIQVYQKVASRDKKMVVDSVARKEGS